MESRFARLRQRDNSVDMLRLKVSRRRSQTQKENRDRALNTRRQLDKLPEQDCSSLETSVMANQSTVKDKAPNVKQLKNSAGEERMKMLARYKEAKELQKEKEKRERERKGVFKVGLYHQQASQLFCPLPPVSAATSRTKKNTGPTAATKKVEPAGRLTRSRTAALKPPPAPPASRTRVAIVEPVPRVPITRSSTRPQAEKEPTAGARALRNRSNIQLSAVPPASRGRNTLKSRDVPEAVCPPSLRASAEEEMEQDSGTSAPVPNPAPTKAQTPPLSSFAPQDFVFQPPVGLSSFAPQDFVFQPPVGLSSFQPMPLTPRSAEAFLAPSCTFSYPPVPLFSLDNLDPEAELSAPAAPKSPLRPPPRPSPSLAPLAPASPQEPQHNVAYFRSAMVSETDRLFGQCQQWEQRVDDNSIPEEMRDGMRTVIGQARLLMKERFGQFRGLVDDCELSRGEKITTCTDLQGFWDMVYYQVEDVNRKFGALSEAESRGWLEEHKPPPRQKKMVKKPPPSAPSKPNAGPGANVAAKSRLAAIKAAMKARQQAAEAEKADQAEAIGSAEDQPALEPPHRQDQAPETLVFNGGFFQVESPAKLTGPVRRSSRLIGAVLPQPSPCQGSSLSTPGRTRSSCTASPLALPPRCTPARTPACLKLTLSHTTRPQSHTPRPQSHTPRPQACTPQSSVHDPARGSLCFSPLIEAPPYKQDEVVPDQPECGQMQDHIACNQSEVNTEASEHIGQPQLAVDVPPQILSQSMQAVEPQELDGLAVSEEVSPVPSTPARQGRAASPEACDSSVPLITSLYPSLPLSPPNLPLSPPSHRADSPPSSPTNSPALSFSLSPCSLHTPARVESSLLPLSSPSPMSSSPPAIQISSPALLSSPGACGSPLHNDSISEGVPQLDFERYLQPAPRPSLSPQAAPGSEMSSPTVDVEMDSPGAQPGDHSQDGLTPIAFPRIAQTFTPRTPQAAEHLLFFSPAPRERLRQSVCPSDLMVFTPPSDR
ncbi:disks large-associated protein 5 isoform X2 [Hypomesus transpacificus]|uniref:disks large-associated protein 5 isoform X2 n=1 Tax=Hypomesus transpacificus TaxID=137520 RepID=UPI001F073083|nr:disks large-associated protein 5 isoform X2 [Hypomesus transpacificus]